MLTAAVLPAADRVLGQRMMARYRHLRRVQWWPRERVLQERDGALPALIAAALETEVYRELYADAGIDPRSVRTAADLRHLPIVSKAELRDGFPERTTRPTGQPTYDECSAGSTGQPFCVREDAQTAGWYRASFLQILSWAGWRIGEPHVLLGITPARPRGRAIKDRLLRCEYVHSYDLSDEALDRTLDHLRTTDTRFMFGYPVAMHELAKRAVERGLDVPLTGVVTWGDNLDAAFRRTIEATFGTPVLDAYGCAEGMWIASQCPERDLYHVHSSDIVLELLDDDGEPVPAGTPGHVVVTRLHPGPSPLVRYRTGDLAVRSDADCPCGRGYETVREVVGRSADTITTPAGNRLIIHFFTGILEHYPELETFQVAKVSPTAAEVRVVAPTLGGEREAALLDDLRRRAPDMEWRLRSLEHIDLTASGKRRFVIDETKSP